MGFDPTLCEPQFLGRSENLCNTTGTVIAPPAESKGPPCLARAALIPSTLSHVGTESHRPLLQAVCRCWCQQRAVSSLLGASRGAVGLLPARRASLADDPRVAGSNRPHAQYHNKDVGHGCKQFGQAVPWKERRLFCADVFEAEPGQTKALQKEVAYHHGRGRNMHLYASTPFSLTGGDVVFNSIGTVNNAGGVCTPESANSVDDLGAVSNPNRMVLHSMNAINYLRGRTATHLVLKIDVESYEFELVRGLISSGVLCVPGRKTDLFIEWHVPRPRPNGTFHHLFNESAYGLPRLSYSHRENMDAFAARDAMIWMLRSPACRNVTTHKWW